MSLPTLLKKGMLVPHMGETDLNDKVPVDYIVGYISELNDKRNDLTISDRLIIILAKTGAGKSTILPVQLSHTFKNKKILVTQPRVITAIEIAKDIADRKENKMTLYQNIGYQTKENVRKPQQRGVLFATLGILLQYLKNIKPENFCKMFKCILIDEAHDNSIDRDLIAFYIKKLINSVDIMLLPFIIFMSATLNINEFSNYFNTKTIFEVNGVTYPIQAIYREPDKDYISEICNIVKKILIENNIPLNNRNNDNNSNNNNSNKMIEKKNDGNDIIIFCTSMASIISIIKQLKYFIDEKFVNIIALDSTNYDAVGKDYERLIKSTHKLKIILSTNVAETGITIPNLKYCIDTGFYTSVSYNPINNSTVILNKIVDQSMAVQRKGRVGRKTPGIWYALYSEETFNKMNVFQLPEIYKTNLDNFVLNTIDLYENDIENNIFNLDYINKPAYDSIKSSLNKLFLLGFIEYKKDKKLKITEIGKMSKVLFRTQLEYVKILLSSYFYNINILDILTIICIIETKFTSNYIHENVNCNFINNLIIVKKIVELSDKQERKEMCKKYNINYKTIKYIIIKKYELIKEFTFSLKLEMYKNNINILELINHELEFIEYVTNIKYCLFEGMKLNLLKYNKYEKIYKNRYGNNIIIKSALINNYNFKPEYIMTNSIVNDTVKDNVCVLDNYVNIDVTFNVS